MESYGIVCEDGIHRKVDETTEFRLKSKILTGMLYLMLAAGSYSLSSRPAKMTNFEEFMKTKDPIYGTTSTQYIYKALFTEGITDGEIRNPVLKDSDYYQVQNYILEI